MRLVVLALLAACCLTAPAADADQLVPASPQITGRAEFGAWLSATPGSWMPEGATVKYRWLRDGVPIKGAVSDRYRARLDDIGHRLGVRVRASTGGAVEAAPTDRVRHAAFTLVARPTLRGAARFDHVLSASPGDWSPRPSVVRYQWLRDGEPIRGARRARYRLGVPDVGARLGVRVTAVREGYRRARAESRVVLGRHRSPVRRAVTYSVTTRGRIHADLGRFARLAQQTFDDPRGWRGAGIAFRRVRAGGDFRLVLSQAELLPSFGYPCDSTWSCRAGDDVVVNQTRWLHASPMWNARDLSLRGYRHMVVNHETGHWLGHRHRYCPGPGRLAPVMMQQSKGLQGCRANPWPRASERSAPRFGRLAP